MVHKRKETIDVTKSQEQIIKKEILKMDKKGKSIDEIDEVLVYDMGFSPEYSWKLIKSTLKLKEKVR
jgi:hypothetical protein